MLIDKTGIVRLIPHAYEMCLLDGVLSWDQSRIRCMTDTHRTPHNPLRRHGRLGILCGVEYAAQAMAVHGALSAKTRSVRGGYLASVRGLTCHTDRLDLVPGSLFVETERLHGDGEKAIYGFVVREAGGILLTGRAAVVLADIAA